MTIDWNNFTPLGSLVGGLMIGTAAVLLLQLNGKIAGINGGLLNTRRADAGWRLALIAGVLLSPTVYRLAAGAPEMRVDAGYPVLIVAGLLVGVGTR